MKQLKFAAVGCLGFVVDSSVFMALLKVLDNVDARICGFFSAAFVTWGLNRSVTFVHSKVCGLAINTRQCLTYITCAGFSFSINVGLFYYLDQHYLWAQTLPILAMIPGIVLGSVTNYLFANYWIFSSARNPEHVLQPS